MQIELENLISVVKLRLDCIKPANRANLVTSTDLMLHLLAFDELAEFADAKENSIHETQKTILGLLAWGFDIDTIASIRGTKPSTVLNQINGIHKQLAPTTAGCLAMYGTWRRTVESVPPYNYYQLFMIALLACGLRIDQISKDYPRKIFTKYFVSQTLDKSDQIKFYPYLNYDQQPINLLNRTVFALYNHAYTVRQ